MLYIGDEGSQRKSYMICDRCGSKGPVVQEHALEAARAAGWIVSIRDFKDLCPRCIRPEDRPRKGEGTP